MRSRRGGVSEKEFEPRGGGSFLFGSHRFPGRTREEAVGVVKGRNARGLRTLGVRELMGAGFAGKKGNVSANAC